MLKIGDFSRLSRVSIRMLRYYDDAGVIKPVKVDKFTGYRYYREAQLLTMGKINALREMGFGVAAIGEIIQCEHDKEAMERMFAVQKAQLLEEKQVLQDRIRLLDTAIVRLREEKEMKYDCIVKEMPARDVASVRQVIPSYEDEGRLWHILYSETVQEKLVSCGTAMAILHDQEYKESNVDVEVQIEVKGTYTDTEHVKFKTEPAIAAVASTTFKGSYSQFSDVYAALAAWVSDNGYEFAGPMMNICHVSPNETKNPEEFVTEICCPVKKK